MQTIKFNDNYPKLQGQKEAILVDVQRKQICDMSQVFLDYDTKKSDGDHYVFLPHEKVLVLYFVGRHGILFTSIRKDHPDKQHYFDEINQLFKIEVQG